MSDPLKKQAGDVDALSLQRKRDMFRVDVDSLKDYLDFDLKRKLDLQRLDKLIRKSAPGLQRYFHTGTPAGEPGMRFKMIGYGKFHYVAGSGKNVDWPVVGGLRCKRTT